MEEVVIKNSKNTILLYLNNNSFFGYQFKDNKISPVDKSVFNLFDFLYPSNNYTYLGKENSYDVVLDNNTKFKHYIKDNSFDLSMFFLNNGENNISFEEDIKVLLSGEKIESNNQKVFNVGKTLFITTFAALSLINTIQLCIAFDVNSKVEEVVFSNIEQGDLTTDAIFNMIDSSTNLTNKEKEYLKNKDLIDDILPFINNDNYIKYTYLKKLNELNVVNFTEGEEKEYPKSQGFYRPSEKNVLHIRNYGSTNMLNKDVLAHEYIHLFQHDSGYGVIKEACAEIISNEYFEECEINAYKEEVQLLKVLMEIIGPEVIFKYNFDGDFSPIEEKVRPYLSEEDYSDFLLDLQKSDSEEEATRRLTNLGMVLAKLHQNVLGYDINDNKIIKLIGMSDTNIRLERYYFNYRKINKENSYYYLEDYLPSAGAGEIPQHQIFEIDPIHTSRSR